MILNEVKLDEGNDEGKFIHKPEVLNYKVMGVD